MNEARPWVGTSLARLHPLEHSFRITKLKMDFKYTVRNLKLVALNLPRRAAVKEILPFVFGASGALWGCACGAHLSRTCGPAHIPQPVLSGCAEASAAGAEPHFYDHARAAGIFRFSCTWVTHLGCRARVTCARSASRRQLVAAVGRRSRWTGARGGWESREYPRFHVFRINIYPHFTEQRRRRKVMVSKVGTPSV